MLYQWQPDKPIVKIPEEEFTTLLANPQQILWLDLESPTPELQQWLHSLSFIHPITIERIINGQSRAFMDEFEEYLHILLHQIQSTQSGSIELLPCHWILGNNFLISLHFDSIEALREYQNERPPARFFSQGSDQLFYHLVSPIINTNFSVLDAIAERTEDVEDRIFPKPDKSLLNELFILKKDLIAIRKAIAPMREVFSLLSRRENPFVDETALPFMNHLYDQLIRLHEISDSQRETVSGALEIYLSSLSNRTNEVMMTLTVVSTLILPPTFIVGYYGMNFKLPEFGWKYGFFYVITLIIGISAALLWYFRKKHWF